MSDTTQELIADLQRQISDAERQCYIDCERYDEENRERIRKRHDCLYFEVRLLRAQLNEIFKRLSEIEGYKPPTPIIVKAGIDL